MLCLGEPATETLHCAAQQQVDFIVINSRGGGGSPLPFLGSVAEKVVRTAPCPVLTLRYPEHEVVAADAPAAVPVV